MTAPVTHSLIAAQHAHSRSSGGAAFTPAVTLRVNFSYAVIGNLTYAACQWGILVALAKLGTVEMVGQYAYALAVTTPLFLLANLQLNALQITDDPSNYLFRDYLSIRFATCVVASVIVGVIAAVFCSGALFVVVFLV